MFRAQFSKIVFIDLEILIVLFQVVSPLLISGTKHALIAADKTV